jgi:hypothetical protein
MYKDYNETEFNALNITLNDYQKSRILAAQNIRTDVAKFYPCELSFTVQDERYLDVVDVILQHEHQNTFTIEVSYRDKFYALTSSDYSNFKNISNYDRRKIRDEVEAPNKIGVLSTKKIQDWIIYHESIYNKVKQISDENTAKIDDFLKSIEPLPFTYRDDKNRGEIVKNNIRFSYYISDGCISKSLELISTTATIKNFLKLSDNSITIEKP